MSLKSLEKMLFYVGLVGASLGITGAGYSIYRHGQRPDKPIVASVKPLEAAVDSVILITLAGFSLLSSAGVHTYRRDEERFAHEQRELEEARQRQEDRDVFP